MSASSSQRPASSSSGQEIDEKAPARPSSPTDQTTEQHSATAAGSSSSTSKSKGKQPIRDSNREHAPSPEQAPWQPGRHEPKKYRQLLPAAAPPGSAENAQAHVFLGTVNHALRETSKVTGYEDDYEEESEEDDDDTPDLEEDEGSEYAGQRAFEQVFDSRKDVKYDAEWGGEVDIEAQLALMREYEDTAMLRQFGEAALAVAKERDEEEEARLRPRRRAPEPPGGGPSKRNASASPGEGPLSPSKKGPS